MDRNKKISPVSFYAMESWIRRCLPRILFCTSLCSWKLCFQIYRNCKAWTSFSFILRIASLFDTTKEGTISPINSRPLLTGWRTPLRSFVYDSMLIYSSENNNTRTSKWRGTRSIETRRRLNRGGGGGVGMKWKRFARSQTWIVPRL